MDDSVASSPPTHLRIGAIIQARWGSTRLPGKVLLPLPLGSATTLLQQVIARAQRAHIATVIVATSNQSQDDAVAEAAAATGAAVFRGSEADVLSRFFQAATEHQLQVVIRLTADNPAIDPHYLNRALEQHLLHKADYTLTTGLPLGTNLEIISYPALAAAHHQAVQPEEREHVTPYVRRHPELFQLLTLPLAPTHQWADVRLTVDYPSDYALLHTLYTALPPDFGLAEVAALFKQYPWLPQANNYNEQIRV